MKTESIALQFSPDGTQVVTASGDNTARVWDVASGTVVAELTGHEGGVTSAAFSPDGTQVVTASGTTPRACGTWRPGRWWPSSQVMKARSLAQRSVPTARRW